MSPMIYRIAVKGHIDQDWDDWFAEMQMHYTAGGETLLEGPVVDQAALHGLINKVFMLGLTLLGISRLSAAVGENAMESLFTNSAFSQTAWDWPLALSSPPIAAASTRGLSIQFCR